VNRPSTLFPVNKPLLASLVIHLFLLSCSPHPVPAPILLPGATVEISNETAQDVTAFVSFGADSVVLPSAWPFCQAPTALTCQIPIKAHQKQPLPLAGKYLNATIGFGAPVSCGSTKAEINVNNPKWYDTADISLVDGFSTKLAITVADPSTKIAKTLGPVTSKTGNEKAFGVYPLGCDICVARQQPPCGQIPGRDGCKAGPDQYHPDVPCQFQGSVMGGGSQITIFHLGL